VSLWQPGQDPAERDLLLLAQLACTTAWRPKNGEEEAGVRYWSPQAAVAQLVAAAAGEGSRADQATCEGVANESVFNEEMAGEGLAVNEGVADEGPGPATVEVELREEYRDEEGRRARAYKIAFTRRGVAHSCQVTKGDVALWQARVREALHLWSDGEGTFHLR